MVEETPKSVRIDLNQFKLHLYLKPEVELTLHFDSPSRRFYLSVIALVVHEMKKRGRITSIPLQEHLDVLALLNKTIGAAAGSSKKEHLLPRIYRKWKDVLPDLENAPLFKVVGRKKRFDELMDKVYGFNEGEKDSWANLFEYKGSHEHVRLRFSIDRLGASLDDVIIVYGEYPELANVDAWEGFIAGLKEKLEEKSRSERAYGEIKEPESPLLQPRRWMSAMIGRWQRPALFALIALVVGAAALAIWNFYLNQPSIAPASVERMAFPLPDKPSIAVLPFDNMSGDPEQEYFCDGLTEEIITALSIIPDIFVIARHSTFTYKGKPVKVQQVSEELGVRYVLEGSVRKSEERVRITVQLIDALAGKHVWAERYEQDLKETFALQDEITVKVVNAMQVELTEGEAARLRFIKTPRLDLYLKAWQANGYLMRLTKEGNTRARQLLEEYIALAPDSPVGWTLLAEANLGDVWLGLSKSPRESVAQTEEMAKKAIDLGTHWPNSRMTLSRAYLMQRKHEKAIAEAELALALAPNSAWAHLTLGANLMWAGRHEEAIPLLEKTLRLDPFPTHLTYIQLCVAYRCLGRYEEAVAACEKSLQLEPDFALPHASMAAAYSLAGRDEEARATVQEALRLDARISLEFFAKTSPFKNQADLKKVLDALRKAGLK